MPRNRMIKTEFWNDEKMALVSRDARLTFIALWNLSDDYGSVRGHHLWLKNTIYPYDEIKPDTFKRWLEELENINAILPYDGEGEKFYYIRCFTKHQVIGRPSQFRNPPPPATLIEDSVNTHGILADETKRERERERESKRVTLNVISEGFNEFWKAYPKRTGKGAAEKAWKKNGRPGIETILDAIAKQKTWRENANGQFRPEWKNPATWLNQKCWEDEVSFEEPTTKKPIITG